MLDREAEPEFNLVAKATDGGGRSCQSDVLLMIQDMNDNPPRFSSSRYEVTVFDNTTVHTPVAVVYAKDPDTGRRAGHTPRTRLEGLLAHTPSPPQVSTLRSNTRSSPGTEASSLWTSFRGSCGWSDL